MKLILLFLILFLGGCDTPKEVAVRTPPKPAIDTMLHSKPISVEPLLDTTSLRIIVVHNPQYPNRYGIELVNEIPVTQDTVTLIYLQKVVLGTIEKHYPNPCPPETEEQRALKLHYDHCAIDFFHPARFALSIPDSIPLLLKCEVYYSLNGVRKVNYHSKVNTIKCYIGKSHGIEPLPGECIWTIGLSH